MDSSCLLSALMGDQLHTEDIDVCKSLFWFLMYITSVGQVLHGLAHWMLFLAVAPDDDKETDVQKLPSSDLRTFIREQPLFLAGDSLFTFVMLYKVSSRLHFTWIVKLKVVA